MPYVYSTPEREKDAHALPDIWVTQFTAEELAEIAESAAEENASGGWCWCYCSPGCLPDSDWIGPFGSYADAVADAQAQAED